MKNKFIIFVLLLATTLPYIALAQVVPNLDNPPAGTITDADGVFIAISNITDWVFSIFLVLSVVFILIAAYNILFAKGNPEGFQESKRMLTYAVIAIIIAVLAKSIVTIAARLVGTTIKL